MKIDSELTICVINLDELIGIGYSGRVGLRRQGKVLVSSEARVRISRVSLSITSDSFLFFSRTVHSKYAKWMKFM